MHIKRLVYFFGNSETRGIKPTWTGVDPSQHALHLGDGVLPAAGAGLHVRLQLVEPVVEVLIALVRQLRLFFGHHQFLQVIL